MISLFGCSNEIEQNRNKEETSGFSIQTSASPNQIHIIELKEMSSFTEDIKDKKVTYGYHSFRIYYGKYGSLLEKYKEFPSFDLTTVEHFETHWTDDNLVIVKIFRKKDDGTTIEAESIKLDTSKY